MRYIIAFLFVFVIVAGCDEVAATPPADEPQADCVLGQPVNVAVWLRVSEGGAWQTDCDTNLEVFVDGHAAELFSCVHATEHDYHDVFVAETPYTGNLQTIHVEAVDGRRVEFAAVADRTLAGGAEASAARYVICA